MPRTTYEDLLQVLQRHAAWRALAAADVSDRYYRTKIGIVWAPLSLIIFVGALSPIYAQLFLADLKVYALHLLLGLMVWNFLFSSVVDATRAFSAARELMIAYELGFALLVARVVWRNLTVLVYQLLAFVVFSLGLGNWPQLSWLFAPLALLLLLSIAFALVLLTAILAARFRDAAEIINNIFRLVFFATPIMWLPNLKPSLAWVVQLNPFYHFIEVFRAPLMSATLDADSVQVTLILALLLNLFAVVIFAKFRQRIAFWL